MHARNMFLIILFVIVMIMLTLNYKLSLENFGNDTSSANDVGGGASSYYGWGYKEQEKKCPKCGQENVCNVIVDNNFGCRHCDITLNKDIDKYVLKSSVPPCPDMSKFATKDMISPSPDMNLYILKTQIPQYCTVGDQYMLKTDCAPQQVADITQHPDFPKYISKDKCMQFKKSWIQNLQDWLNSLSGNTQPDARTESSSMNFSLGLFGNNALPTGYGYSPYAGYGTDNPGYALDGGAVST